MTLRVCCTGLTKSFGDTLALDGLSLDVAAGEIHGLVGPNGSGKSTLIQILAGLLRPDGGTAVVAGFDLATDSTEAKRRTGYVPQVGPLFEGLTVREHLELVSRLYGIQIAIAATRLETALDLLDLRGVADHKIGSLSQGTKQRVVIASALSHQPEVLLMDEPLQGLDVHVVATLMQALARLAADGRTVLISSHLLEPLADVCHRLSVVNHGRLIFTGTTIDMLERTNVGSLDVALKQLTKAPHHGAAYTPGSPSVGS